MLRLRSWIIVVWVLAGLSVGAVGLIALGRFETIDQQYASYADATKAGFGERGWMPDYVPPSATRIRAAHNLDTNWQWLTFHLPARDLTHLLAQGTRVTRLPASRAPFWLSWWPGGLEGGVTGSPFVRIALPGPPQHPERRVRCIAADPRKGIVYAWSCEAEAAA
jgi:hypothetical protein